MARPYLAGRRIVQRSVLQCTCSQKQRYLPSGLASTQGVRHIQHRDAATKVRRVAVSNLVNFKILYGSKGTCKVWTLSIERVVLSTCIPRQTVEKPEISKAAAISPSEYDKYIGTELSFANIGTNSRAACTKGKWNNPPRQ